MGFRYIDQQITPSIGLLNYLAKKYNFNPHDEYVEYCKTPNQFKLLDILDCFEGYVKEIEFKLNTNRTHFLNKSRKREITYLRHMLAFICCENNLGGVRSIGDLIGVHYSTVIHSRDISRDLIETNDPIFMPIYNSLKHLIND